MAAIKRVVLFKFKPETPAPTISQLLSEVRGFKNSIPGVNDVAAGADASGLNLNQGFSHGFVITFQDEAARESFSPHKAHQDFVGRLGPNLDGILAFDIVH